MIKLYFQIAAPEIAMIKIAAPNMTQRVCDRAMQSFGGMGMSADTPIASKCKITTHGKRCPALNIGVLKFLRTVTIISRCALICGSHAKCTVSLCESLHFQFDVR